MSLNSMMAALREEEIYTAPEAVYEKGGDVHVRKYMVYGDTSDSKLYASSDFQKILDPERVYACAMYGDMTVFDGTNYLSVVSFVKDSYKTVDLSGGTPASKTWTVATEAKDE